MKLPGFIKTYSGLPRSIYILFIARIINSLGAFVYPFLTMFLTDKMGIGEQQAGLYVMMAATAGVPGSLIGGKLSDHFGRKKIMIVFQSMAAIAFIPCAFLGNSIIVPWLLILASFFGGAAGPASSAMTADLTNQENRKAAFSLLYLGINFGFAVGPLVAGFLYNNYIHWIFLGDAITTLISLVLVAIFVEETIPTEEKLEESQTLENDESAEKGNLFTVLLRRPSLLAFAAVSTIYSFVFAQHMFSLPIQIKEVFGMENGSKIFGTLMTTNAIVVVAMTVFITNITKKIRPILNISLAGIFCAVGFGMLYFSKLFTLFILSTVIWTIGEILNVTNSGVYIANHTPMSHRGRFNSILPLISGAGWALAPYIMGGFIEKNGVRMVWPVTFILAIGSGLLMFVLYIFEKRKNNKELLVD